VSSSPLATLEACAESRNPLAHVFDWLDDVHDCQCCGHLEHLSTTWLRYSPQRGASLLGVQGAYALRSESFPASFHVSVQGRNYTGSRGMSTKKAAEGSWTQLRDLQWAHSMYISQYQLWTRRSRLNIIQRAILGFLSIDRYHHLHLVSSSH
jgi:hypothetical protein